MSGSAATATLPRPGAGTGHPVTLVDSDVHPLPRRFSELRPYLPVATRDQGWLDHVEMDKAVYPVPVETGGVRADSLPDDGAAGSDPALLRRQLLEIAGVDIAMLIPLPVSGMANPEQEAALLTATNTWLAETWLGSFEDAHHFRGSISVVASRPDLAVQEIEQWGTDRRFAQVLLDPYQLSPLGQHHYHPIYEAASALGLPVAMHVKRTPGSRLLTPVGYLSYYAELHPLYSMPYIAHLVSMVMEGVFERFPDLKLVLLEGGIAWAAPLMWRLDKYWEAYGSELPLLSKPPSAYIREHVRLTTQPLEEPRRIKDFHDMLEWMECDELLLFSSDYPHWDFDDPSWVAKRLPESMRQRVMAQNAIDLYGLPTVMNVA